MLRKGLVLFFCIAVTVSVIASWGQVTRLTCTRVGAGEPASCVKTTAFFWLLQLGNEKVPGVQGATVVGCDCEAGGIRVELLTAQGNIPLNWSYDGTPWGFLFLYDDRNRINDFVSGENDTQEVVIVEDKNAIVILINLLIFIIWFFRGSMRAWLSRPFGVRPHLP